MWGGGGGGGGGRGAALIHLLDFNERHTRLLSTSL